MPRDSEIGDVYSASDRSGWIVNEIRPPVGTRAWDWQGFSVDYDLGDPVFHGRTRESVIESIEEHIREEAVRDLA